MMQTTMGCFPVVVNSVSLGQKKIMKEKSNKQQATSNKQQATSNKPQASSNKGLDRA